MSAVTKELIRGEINLKPRHYGCVATIGSFDGVHLGHQAIIHQLSIQSQALQLPAVAVIFEPQPREFFRIPVARITPLREKALALFAAGIDRVLCLHFDRALSQIEPEQFVKRILVDGLGVRHLLIGDDFRFGRDRAGDDELLSRLAAKYEFEIASTEVVELGGERVSSTLIRESLANGEFERAARLLGREFRIVGRVVRGQQLGTQLGIPTVNVNLRRMVSPISGTFAVKVAIDSDVHSATLKGVANVGVRPTVGGLEQPILEGHLFDFDDDIYGERIHVTFKEKIRDERKFSSLDELKSQINRDISAAKRILQVH